MTPDEQHRLLEALIVDNDNLEQLEDMIAEFNIFETMGAVRQELRHSDFLAFLLNPSGKHGLGSRFLKRFLKRVVQLPKSNISAIDVDVLDLSGAVVERESNHIDVLVHDMSVGFVCVIENKIYSGEHSDQLNRYLEVVENRFGKDIEHLILIFLSPDGTPPEDDNSPYIPVSYSLVHDTIETVRQRNQASLGASVNMSMEHYATMLRRHLMDESDIAELCRKIYAEHKDALDLIFQHKPDARQRLSEELAQWITVDNELSLDRPGYEIKFYPTVWESIPQLKVGTGIWSRGGLVIMMLVQVYDDVVVKVIIGPSDNQDIRRRIFDELKQKPFFNGRKNMAEVYSQIYRKQFISRKQMENEAVEDLLVLLKDKWNTFLTTDFLDIHATITSILFK